MKVTKTRPARVNFATITLEDADEVTNFIYMLSHYERLRTTSGLLTPRSHLLRNQLEDEFKVD